MKMIRAIIRPHKADKIAEALKEKGFPSMTRMDVYGRGRQVGMRVGEIYYNELPKHMIMMVIADEDEKVVVDTIMDYAVTGTEGNVGDGRIFVTNVEKSYKISSKTVEM